MPKLNELEQLRAAKLAEATAALRSDKPAEERFKAYDGAVAEMGKMDEEIARHRAAEKLESEERTRLDNEERDRRSGRPILPAPTDQNKDHEEREENKEEVERRNKQHKRAFNHYLATKDDSQLRAMNSTTGANGGYTIPTMTEPQLVQALLSFGGVASFLDGLETASGEQINWPLNNDTANSGREIGENVQVTDTDLTIGTVASTVGLFSTDAVLAPRTLLRDSTVDLASKIIASLAIRRARKLSSVIINGTQTNSTFTSLLTGATLGATTAAPTAIGLTDMSEIFGAVDPGYAVNGKFVMHRSTQIYLSTLRNGLGAPIFPLDANGMLTKLFGCDIVIDQSMPAITGGAPAAGQKLILFGDLKSYLFRTVGTMEVMRLEERYADYNQIGFMGWYSAGGQLIDAGTHPIQSLAQHA